MRLVDGGGGGEGACSGVWTLATELSGSYESPAKISLINCHTMSRVCGLYLSRSCG